MLYPASRGFSFAWLLARLRSRLRRLSVAYVADKRREEGNLCLQGNTWGPKPLLINSSAFPRSLFALSTHSVYNHS